MKTSDWPPVLCGLIGNNIQLSRTPAMHEREGAEQGLRYIYKLIDLVKLGIGPDKLPELLTAAERMGFSGLNITHPCKQLVIPLLTELSEDAKALGAVNTVVFRDGKRIGQNTDWWGYAEAFKQGLPDVKMDKVVQMGAGGAGAAVSHSVVKLGAKQLTIFDVDASRAQAVVANLGARVKARVVAGTDFAKALAEADGVVNTTPMGTAAHPGMAVPAELLRPGLWVSEIVYFPLETELLRVARAKGCRTLDGGGMAVFQAVEAFRLFTGVKPDAERMRSHFASMGNK
jgi:shikimate dehydrogenase